MKKSIISIICVMCIIYTMINANKISDFATSKISNNQSLIIEPKNEYVKEENFLFVKRNEQYIPYSYNDLLDIIYTVINNGWDSFTFYCPAEYTNCLKDIEQISKDDLVLTHINNFVHPFNSFTMLSTSISTSGEITLKVNHVYSKEQINAINLEVNRIINLIVKPQNSDYDNLKIIHDYIINNTRYDETKKENTQSRHASEIAYGALFDHYATCNGYTDTMAIFLSKLGIKNYKIATTKEDLKNSSTGHVWNAVWINNKWLHLDLTWDDPVSSDNKDYLYHKYFLITTEELKKADSGETEIEEHNFNKKIYLEFNEKSQYL